MYYTPRRILFCCFGLPVAALQTFLDAHQRVEPAKPHDLQPAMSHKQQILLLPQHAYVPIMVKAQLM